MNNKKYSKIIVFALSLALLIGAAVGIVANAENAESAPEILAKNIEYGDTLKFMVAIDSESVGGEGKTVTFSVYEGDPDNNGKMLGKSATAVYKDTSETNLGVNFAYIGTATYGISPLAYGENYYLVVECDGAKTVTQYSAIEYFLERLYGDDIINATEEKELLQKEIYENAIAYGSSVQKYAKYEGKFNGTNVADYNYVKVEGGTINGASTAVLADGEYTVTLTGSAPAGLSHIGWTVGDTDFTGNTVTISENCTVAPKYQTSNVTSRAGETFANFVFSGDGAYKGTYGVGYTAIREGSSLTVVDDPADATNKVLEFVDNNTSSASGVRVQEKTLPGVSSASNNITVFEARMYINGADYSSNREYIGQWGFYSGGTSNNNFNIIYEAERDTFRIESSSTSKNTTLDDAYYVEIDADKIYDQWVSIRFEYHNSTDTSKVKTLIYINNELVLTCSRYKNTSDVNNFRLMDYSDSKGTVYFDDVSCYAVGTP
ncbi:MAG: hypothetical protein J6B48_10285 [Clostridia bacterium]|nr:hypothetical protein [Clostridia bacterium]